MKDFSKYKFIVRRSPDDPRDWKASAIYKKIALPDVVDYRDRMFPVRDQGSQGSCVAMAGAAMKEWQERIDVMLDEYMSPQFIYNNREDITEEGMYVRDLMNILRKKGVCVESFYPYGAFKEITKEVYDNALNFIIENYASIDTITELKTALYINGPCIIAVPVYNLTERMWKKKMGDYLLGYHLLCVAGYNEDGFIIRNSWGDDWGQKGYCIFPYEDWGCQMETWTTVDANSYKPEPPVPEPEKENWFKKYWWILILSAVAIGMIIFLVLTLKK